MKVFYLCDGMVPGCEMKEICYKRGGRCRHTSDVEHAVNFQKSVRGNTIWERKGSNDGDIRV